MSIDLSGPVSIDLGDVNDEPPEEGWHTVEIERAEAKLTRQKQLPSIFVMGRITDEADPEYNRTIIWNSILSGNAMRFTKRFFDAVGMPEQLDYPSYQALADDLIGRVCEVEVKHREYEGELQANVNKWREISIDLEL